MTTDKAGPVRPAMNRAESAECGCGKIPFASRREAKQHSRRYQGKRLGKVRAYQCDGGFWHLTASPASKTAHFRALRAGEET